jgi:hypothetical protein
VRTRVQLSDPLPAGRALSLACAGVSLAWLAGLTACAPAYDPCFTPASVVQELRVLGVRIDPPEALVDLDAGVVPEVQVRALLAGQADAMASIQLTGSLCIPTADLHCPAGSFTVRGPLSRPGAPEGTLALRAPPELVALAREADPLRGYGGTRVQLELRADVTVMSAIASTSATKTLLFSEAVDTPAPNQAIELGPIEVTLDGGLQESAALGQPEDLYVGHSYGLRPRLLPLADGGSPLETYTVTDLSGNPVTLREHVSYDFFAMPDVLFGDLPIDNGTPIGVYIDGAGVADEPQHGSPEPPNGLVRATPMLSSEARIWVVGRDSRGAVAWTWFDAHIFDARMCDGPNGLPCPPGKSCCLDPFIGCK